MAETPENLPTTDTDSSPQNPSSSGPTPIQEPQPQTTPPSISSTQPPGSSASVPESIALSGTNETATPSLGGSSHTQVNVVNRQFTPRPSTADKPNAHQFYANLPIKRPGTTETDNDSQISRSTAQRTNFSSTVGGVRRPRSRSHVSAIMPAYSFYHPLKPPAVASASAQQQLSQEAKAMGDQILPAEELRVRDQEIRRTTSMQTEDFSSVHGKPSTEPLLPGPAVLKQGIRPLNPVIENASNRASRQSTQLQVNTGPALPSPSSQSRNGVLPSNKATRNWEHFPGKTKYHLGGRVQFGTQYWANIGTGLLILLPSGLYFAFTYHLCQILLTS
jgi:palmitoyltransferase ZDHHC9/14/18